MQAAAEAHSSPQADAAMRNSDDDDQHEAQDLSAEPAQGWQSVLAIDNAGPAQGARPRGGAS